MRGDQERQRGFALTTSGWLTASTIVLAFACPGVAAAQSAFARDRDIGVLERPHPEYDPAGIRLGAFVLRPELDTSATYNDNLFATESDKLSDTYFTVAPKLTIASDWVRHAVSLTATDNSTFYAKHTSENANQWNVTGNGRLDVTNDTTVNVTLNTGHSILPRSSAAYTQLTTKPIEYDNSGASIAGTKEFNRLRASVNLNVANYDYQDGVDAAGAAIDESFQNRTEYYETGRLDYALSPATAAFLSLTGTQLDYASQGQTQGRNGTGGRVLTGVNFELSHLAHGEVSVGYNKQKFSQDNTQIEGFSYKALVYYYPTPLLTVTLTADQTINASNVIGSVGYSDQVAQVEGDYEFLRNFILTGIVGRTYDKYQDLDRQDARYNLSLGGTYLLNRDVGLKFLYTVLTQDSSGSARGPDFTEQTVGMTLLLRH